MGFSEQAFYEWWAEPVTDQDGDDAHLIDAAIAIHADDPAFGYRFIADELPDHGITAGENRVQRLCSLQRLFSVHSKERGLNREPGPPAHDDLVERDVTATAPKQLWRTDLSEHRTDEGKLYLCAIKDVHSNRIVGYSIGSRMKASLAVTALRNAVARRGSVAECVVHAERGTHFRARNFVHELAHHDLVGSMGRVGACVDNAATESYFALLRKDVLDRQHWSTRNDPRPAIGIWIETTYHRRRRQRRLRHLTPVELEIIDHGLQAA